MNYWSNLFNIAQKSSSLKEGSFNWEDAVLAQQRYWQEWMEASQLWMSWWTSILPPVNWPPTGVVLPPAELNPGGQRPRSHDEGKPGHDEPAVSPNVMARKPRAQVSRHH